MASRIFIIVCFVFFTLCWGCEREYMYRGAAERLQFSTDTISFDTIFTSVGSRTKNLRVLNPVQEDIMIEAIELYGGDESVFILNVNGTAGSSIRDIPLQGNDSLFVFVEVDVNSSDDNTPFVVSDSILFYTRDYIQTVHLIAYGQNVIVLSKDTIKTERFTDEKPYLIYDWVVVDSAETLTIDPGARLHFHKDAFLFVFGSIQVNGEVDNPVLFAGDRTEEWYQDKPGLWGYIHLMPGSSNHIWNNAIIRNGTTGLVVDSVGVGKEDPPVNLKNVRIEHISTYGLLAQQSSIVASNSVFSDCGSAAVALTVGGTYKFYHCTIANYFAWAFRSSPALIMSNYFRDKEGMEHFFELEAAEFHNCIVYGHNENEIGFDFKVDEDNEVADWVNVDFSHSLVKVTQDRVDAFSDAFGENVIINETPSFVDVSKYNYQLDTLSVARDAASINIGRDYPEDIMGNSRLDDDPDMGAFESKD
jgi:hypothetical protein